MVEVCVAIILIGMVIGYLINSGWETLDLYHQFQTQIALEEEAEEEFSNLLASYLITPLDFDSLQIVKNDDKNSKRFQVEIEATPKYAPKETPTIARVELVVTVKDRTSKAFAIRSTRICVSKGKPTKSAKEERE